nr:immunoglobulin heavy chain junction region [Mus musculus]
CAANWGYFDVW